MEDVNKYRDIWIKSPQERLAYIREFRKKYIFTNVQALCIDVWLLWFFSPDKSKTIDPYNPIDWLTFWEFVHIGETCKYSKTLAASYLIHYMNPNINIVICRVYDKDENDIYIASIIDDNYVLVPNNKEVGLWDSMKDKIEIQEKWNIEQVIDVVNHHINL